MDATIKEMPVEDTEDHAPGHPIWYLLDKLDRPAEGAEDGKLDVLRPGTKVTVDSGPVVTVVSVIIHGRDEPFAEYDCEWWDDSTLRTARFDRWRLTAMNGDGLRVGFK